MFSFSHIVGYSTAQVASGQCRTFALQFRDVTDPGKAISVDKLFTIDMITTTTTFGGTMDQIWRWDTSKNGWAKYGYQKPRSGGTAAWRKYNGTSFEELTDADIVQPGETFLYYRGGTATATLNLAGSITELSATPSFEIASGKYQFIAYPWPTEIKISEITSVATFSSLTTTTTFGGTMDQIWRWDTSKNGWAKYGYQKPRSGGTAAWRKYNGSTFEELTDDDKIAAGEGFLYYRGATATLTLTFDSLQSAPAAQ